MAKIIFTLGYEGLSLQAFLHRLKMAGVRTVVDVRANPLSRKPGFSKRAFSEALNEAGINYRHLAAMGCPKTIRDRYRDDGDWALYTRKFLRYLESQSRSLAELAAIAERSPTCLVCFEADYKQCHRSYVANAVAETGNFKISHLTVQTGDLEVLALSAA